LTRINHPEELMRHFCAFGSVVSTGQPAATHHRGGRVGAGLLRSPQDRRRIEGELGFLLLLMLMLLISLEIGQSKSTIKSKKCRAVPQVAPYGICSSSRGLLNK
jgi:hypothetical protein